MINKPLFLTIINIAGRLINFLLFLIIANKFGANANTDWFFLNYGVVYFLVGILFNASEYTLVPIWNKTDERHHPFIFAKLFNYSIFLLFIFIGVIFIVSFIVSPVIGVDLPSNNNLAIVIICLTLSIQPPLALVSSICSSYLQYKRKYVLPTIHLAIRSLGILPILLLNTCNSILCLTISFLSGEILRFACLFRKKYYHFVVNNTSQHTDIIDHIIKGTAWMTIAFALIVANPLVDLAMVGTLSDGSVSLVEYAGRLRGLPILAFNGILIMLLGEWANLHAKTDQGLKWNNVARYFYPSLLISSLAVIILIISIDYWINLVFFSSKFTHTDIESLKNLLTIYFIGIPMLIGVFILTRVVIIFQQYRAFTIIASCGFILNILLNYFFMTIFGINGIALSTSSIDLLTVIALYILTRKILHQDTPR